MRDALSSTGLNFTRRANLLSSLQITRRPWLPTTGSPLSGGTGSSRDNNWMSCERNSKTRIKILCRCILYQRYGISAFTSTSVRPLSDRGRSSLISSPPQRLHGLENALAYGSKLWQQHSYISVGSILKSKSDAQIHTWSLQLPYTWLARWKSVRIISDSLSVKVEPCGQAC